MAAQLNFYPVDSLLEHLAVNRPILTPNHRLARRMGSNREAVLICYLIGGATGLAAVFLTQATAMEAIVVGALIVLTGLYGAWWLEFLLNRRNAQ